MSIPEQSEQIKKTAIERKLLELQLSHRFQRREDLKVIAGLGGVLAAIVAIGSLLLSFYFSQNQEILDRELRIDTRLDKAFVQLASENGNERLSAVTVLQSFLANKKYPKKSLILIALTNTLAVEDDSMVRSYIVRVLTATDKNLISAESQNEALQNLIEISQALVIEGKLDRNRRTNPFFLPEKTNHIELRAHNVGQSIIGMLKAGADSKDLSGTYLVQLDFSGMKLSETDFSDAILAFSKFIGTTCTGCNFDGSDIENTLFQNATLDNSKFTLTERSGAGEYRSSYVNQLLSRGMPTINGPDFSGASLVRADFSGHPLFGFLKDGGFHLPGNFFAPKFHKANLKEANFREIRIYTLSENRDWKSPIFTYSGGGSGLHEQPWSDGVSYWIYEYELNSESQLTDTAPSYGESMRDIAYSFSEANWEDALLPVGIMTYLQQYERKAGDVPNE